MTKNDLPHAPPWGAKYKTRRALNGSGGGWPPWNTCGSLKQNKTKPKTNIYQLQVFFCGKLKDSLRADLVKLWLKKTETGFWYVWWMPINANVLSERFCLLLLFQHLLEINGWGCETVIRNEKLKEA